MDFLRKIIEVLTACNCGGISEDFNSQSLENSIDVDKLNPIEKLIYEESGIFKLEEYWKELEKKERAYSESMDNIKRAKQKNINFHIENAAKPEYGFES